jgi:hypothetical protein
VRPATPKDASTDAQSVSQRLRPERAAGGKRREAAPASERERGGPASIDK